MYTLLTMDGLWSLSVTRVGHYLHTYIGPYTPNSTKEAMSMQCHQFGALARPDFLNNSGGIYQLSHGV